MSRIVNLGRYIDLISMDKYYQEISIALHVRESEEGHLFTLHTYSKAPGADGRLKNCSDFLTVLGGLEPFAGPGHVVRFPCGELHEIAIKRVFNEVIMLDPAALTEPGPLTVYEKKTGRNLVVDPEPDGEGHWTYTVSADGQPEGLERRVKTYSAGLAKLLGMERVDDSTDRLRFPCGFNHQATISLMMKKALNVRAIIAADEADQKKGVLASPSQQSST